MGMHRKMCVGTGDGVVLLKENDTKWELAGSSLPGKPIEDIVVLPNGSIFCGVPHDGVYSSSDGGAHWDRVIEIDVRAMAAALPLQPTTIYAATEPVGLYRSSDGGDSWQEIEALRQMPEEIQEQWFFPGDECHEGHVKTINVNPKDPMDILLGIEHGGVVRTRDGGLTWEDLSEGIEYLDVHVVNRDPVQDELFYVTTARGFYRSENGGHDWIMRQDGVTRDFFHDFVVQPGAATSLFLATANGSPPSWIRDGGSKSAIYRSEDGARSWQQMTGGLGNSLEPMVWGLVGDPEDDSRLYAAIGTGVWASDDRGDSWDQIYDGSSALRTLSVIA
ncbi:MAG TPA: hypothetical protein VGK54_12020 [Chloroflexota bacterium]